MALPFIIFAVRENKILSFEFDFMNKIDVTLKTICTFLTKGTKLDNLMKRVI